MQRQANERERGPGKECDIKVSVIVPLYNSEKCIHSCIECITNQSYKNLEIIFIVDSRSEDDTFKKISECSESLNNCRILLQHDNNRTGGARNIGLDASTGDYVWFVDVDDYPHPTFVKEMLDIALEYDCDTVICNHFYSRRLSITELPKKEYKKIIMTEKQAINKVLDGKIPIPTWTKLYRRKMLVDNHLYYTPRHSEDYDYTIRSFMNSNKLVYYNKPLYTYVLAGNSTSSKNRDDIAIEDVNVTIRLADLAAKYGINYEEFCTRAFVHLLHSFTNVSLETFDKLSKNYFIKKILKYKQRRRAETFLYRIHPRIYYVLGKLLRKIKFSRRSFMFDSDA